MIALLKKEMIILLMFIFYFAALWLKNKDKKIKIRRIYGVSVQTEKSIGKLCREISISVKTGVLFMLILGIIFVILDYQYATAMIAKMQEALGNGDIMRLVTVNMESRYSLFLRILRILIPGCIMGSFVVKMYRNPNE